MLVEAAGNDLRAVTSLINVIGEFRIMLAVSRLHVCVLLHILSKSQEMVCAMPKMLTVNASLICGVFFARYTVSDQC